MVELIVVILLIGIIGGIAAGRFFERSSYDTAAWAEQVKATLRQAQKLAVARNNPVYVHMSLDRIAVCLDADAACAAADARAPAFGGSNSGSAATRTACGSDSWMCEGRPAGVTMGRPGNTSQAPGGVLFDGLGRARMVDGFGGSLEVRGDGLVRTVTIAPESGYVD